MVEPRQSNIHGMGLFATTDIPPGTVIGNLEGEPVEKDGPHVIWGLQHADMFRVDNEMRFINHSPSPNAAYYDDGTVIAEDFIRSGEEITHDYGDEW